MPRKGRRGGKAHDDKVTEKVLEKAFDSMPLHHQALAVAEGTLEAAMSVPGSVIDGVTGLASDIYYDACAAYRGGKLRGTMKHKPATKLAVGILIHLLRRKYGIGWKDAAIALDLGKGEARRLAKSKKIQRALKDPVKMVEVLHGKKAAKRVEARADERVRKAEDKARRKVEKERAKTEGKETVSVLDDYGIRPIEAPAPG